MSWLRCYNRSPTKFDSIELISHFLVIIHAKQKRMVVPGYVVLLLVLMPWN
ncbi:hypothetical protein Lalb_Chr02g0159411 [Lupinus albus]|uniref:Uncharacterized protein n=1 Tax=Lupinus albus TaxID=3870 RepID=A0A6A4R3R7_LUPAL|nr:hypothetical protein Lalb_Chr02g0159411 [Lupinus albus]